MAAGYRIAQGYLEVVADHSKADRQMAQFFRTTDGRLRDMRGRFASEGNLAGLGFRRELAKALGMDDLGIGNFLGRFTALMGRGMLSAGKLAGKAFVGGLAGALLVGLGNTAVQGASAFLGQFLAAAVHVGGALAALAPAGILTLVSSLVALKIAFSGVGEALQAGWSGDAAAFAEATKNMAVSTRVFLQDLIKLKPALTEVKRTIQGNFFGPLLGTITPLATIYLPLVQEQFGRITAAFGQSAASLLVWMDTPAAFNIISNLLSNIASTVETFAPALAQLAQTFLVIARVGSDFLPGAAAGFADLVTRFSEFINTAERSGALTAFIQTGLDMLKAFGGALKDIGGIFHAIFSAAPEGTQGLLGVIGNVLSMLNTFLNSASGQAGLTAIFEALSTITGVANTLLERAGPGLVTFIKALGEGLALLLPAAGPVGDALGRIFEALAPLLPALGALLTTLLVPLADLLGFMAVAIEPFIGLLSDLAVQILPMLLPLFATLNQALPIGAQFFNEIAAALAPLVPLLVELGREFVEQLLPVLPMLVQESEPLRKAILDLVKQLVPLVIDLMPALMAEIPALVRLFVLFVQVLGFVVSAAARVVSIIARAVAAYRALMHAGAELIANIRQLPGAIQNVFSSAGQWLVDAGRNIIRGLINGVESMFGALRNKLSSLTSMLPDWKGPEDKDRRILRPAGQAVMGGFMAGIQQRLPDLRDLLSGVTATIPQMAEPKPVATGETAGAGRGGGDFGPYIIQIGDRTLATLVIDAISGAPKEVAAATDEGRRQRTRLNTGRPRT